MISSNYLVLEEINILGICLGAQLMAKKSYEFGDHNGLGWFNAEVINLSKLDVKIGFRMWDGMISLK